MLLLTMTVLLVIPAKAGIHGIQEGQLTNSFDPPLMVSL